MIELEPAGLTIAGSRLEWPDGTAQVSAFRFPSVWSELDQGLRLGMVHDSGDASGRARRMRRKFPDSDVVVFGHSHIPLLERVSVA